MKNFYATWDLMEICTLINLVAMASEESKHKIEEVDANLSKEAFLSLVDVIYQKLDTLKKWLPDDPEDSEELKEDDDSSDGGEVEEDDSEDEEPSFNDREEADLDISITEDEILNFHYGK